MAAAAGHGAGKGTHPTTPARAVGSHRAAKDTAFALLPTPTYAFSPPSRLRRQRLCPASTALEAAKDKVEAKFDIAFTSTLLPAECTAVAVAVCALRLT